MNTEIEIKEIAALDLGFVSHTGTQVIDNAYAKLIQWPTPKGLLNENSKMATIYHDSYKITDPNKVIPLTFIK